MQVDLRPGRRRVQKDTYDAIVGLVFDNVDAASTRITSDPKHVSREFLSSLQHECAAASEELLLGRPEEKNQLRAHRDKVIVKL